MQISGLLCGERATYAQCLAAAKDVVALRAVEQSKVDEFRHILRQVHLFRVDADVIKVSSTFRPVIGIKKETRHSPRSTHCAS